MHTTRRRHNALYRLAVWRAYIPPHRSRSSHAHFTHPNQVNTNRGYTAHTHTYNVTMDQGHAPLASSIHNISSIHYTFIDLPSNEMIIYMCIVNLGHIISLFLVNFSSEKTNDLISTIRIS